MAELIYLDNAATTQVKPEVLEAMLPFFRESYGNASSVYELGQKSRHAIEDAREVIASSLHTTAANIYFTSGGSEADNWALLGVAEAYRDKGKHIITTQIEHHAVLHSAEYLKQHGCEVTYVPVDDNGLINPEDIEAAIRPDTILISVMFANNEIGTIEPIKKIGEIAKAHDILFHTDAVQAYGHVPIDVDAYHIDLLSASGHKLGGPKGIGFLYIRNGISLRSFIHGGAQERSRRAGTENVPAIVGFAKAVQIAVDTMEERAKKETALRDAFIARIERDIPHVKLNGDRVMRLPNNINFCFRFIEGESMLIMLDMEGICTSSGSACTSGSLDPSHVLLAIGLPEELARGSLRLTLSEDTTEAQLDFVADKLTEIVERLRAMSPLYDDFVKGEGA